MPMQTYAYLVENPPTKIYTDYKLAWLMPYWQGIKSLEVISEETGHSVTTLRRWLRKDFADLQQVFQDKSNTIQEVTEHSQSLVEQLANRPMEAGELFSVACHYQQCAIGKLTVDDLVVMLGKDRETIRNHMNWLYGQIPAELNKRDDLINTYRENLHKEGE